MNKFAGPLAQSVLDPVMIRCSIVLFKDNAFLRTSAHESVPPGGYLLATCWLPVGYLLATCGFSFGVATQKVLAKR